MVFRSSDVSGSSPVSRNDLNTRNWSPLASARCQPRTELALRLVIREPVATREGATRSRRRTAYRHRDRERVPRRDSPARNRRRRARSATVSRVRASAVARTSERASSWTRRTSSSVAARTSGGSESRIFPFHAYASLLRARRLHDLGPANCARVKPRFTW